MKKIFLLSILVFVVITGCNHDQKEDKKQEDISTANKTSRITIDVNDMKEGETIHLTGYDTVVVVKPTTPKKEVTIQKPKNTTFYAQVVGNDVETIPYPEVEITFLEIPNAKVIKLKGNERGCFSVVCPSQENSQLIDIKVDGGQNWKIFHEKCRINKGWCMPVVLYTKQASNN